MGHSMELGTSGSNFSLSMKGTADKPFAGRNG